VKTGVRGRDGSRQLRGRLRVFELGARSHPMHSESGPLMKTNTYDYWHRKANMSSVLLLRVAHTIGTQGGVLVCAHRCVLCAGES
jgi:hypothetical protein